MPSVAVLHAVLDGHQVGFFGSKRLVDFGDKAICKLLDLILCTALHILGDLLAFERVLQGVIGVTADIAHRYLGGLTL